jgi:DNA polymerase-3 subunit epsilon
MTSRRCNPGIPIPPEASAVHGIIDSDVSDLSEFSDQSEEIVKLLYGATVAGFNILRFDIPFLNAELDRVNYPLVRIPYAPVLDVMRMFHAHCPRVRSRRNLSLAYELYCGEEHINAHGAVADVLASAKVLDSMIGRHSMPKELELLSKQWS